MKDPRDFLLQILIAIDYKADKETFVDEFLRNARAQSLYDLIQSLPDDKQTQIREQLVLNSSNSEKVAKLIKSSFSEIQLQEALETAFKNALLKYIQTITPVLFSIQKNNLINLFEKFPPPASV